MLLHQAVLDARLGWERVASRLVGRVGYVGRHYRLDLNILILGQNVDRLVLHPTRGKGVGLGRVVGKGIVRGREVVAED